MVILRFPALLIILCLTAGFSYSETVYHLKASLKVTTNAVDIRDVVEEEIPAGLHFSIRTDRKYSNMEVCGILNLLGLKDYVLTGSSIDIGIKEAEAPLTEDSPITAESLMPSGLSDVFYLKISDRGSGDIVFRKGSISIVSRVRIVRNDRDGCLVQNTYSGKKFKVPFSDRSER